MAKYTHPDVLDAALNAIKTNAGRMVACSALPTTFTEANVTYALADVTIDSSDFTGPAAGSSGGSRKVTVAAQADVTIDASDTAINVAILDVTNSKILHVGECNSLALVAGQKVNFPAWDIQFNAPT